MSEALRKKLIYATLPLALIWAAFSMLGKKDMPDAPDPSATTVPDAPAPIVKSEPARIDLEYRKDAPWGRDPFRTPTAATSPEPRRSGAEKLALVLAGIVFSNNQPMALINNQMVRVGDRIGTAIVVEIDKGSVTLEDQGRRFKLTVSKG